MVFQAKQIVKRMLGRKDLDLYDLGTWTVFRADRRSGGEAAVNG
jgi:hypothetical protein